MPVTYDSAGDEPFVGFRFDVVAMLEKELVGSGFGGEDNEVSGVACDVVAEALLDDGCVANGVVGDDLMLQCGVWLAHRRNRRAERNGWYQ